jgi:hypothetical protein
MALPVSRDVNYSPGATPVNGANLNNLQDCIIGRKHPTKTLIIAVSAPVVGIFNTQPVTLSGPPGSSTATWMRQIDGLCVGDRITAIRARVRDSATGPTRLTVTLSHGTDGATSAADGTSAQSSGSGAVQTLGASGLSVIVVSTIIYIVSVAITTGSASCSIFQCEIDIDRL